MYVEPPLLPPGMRSSQRSDPWSSSSPPRSEFILTQSVEAVEKPAPPSESFREPSGLVWVPIVMWGLAVLFVLRTLELSDAKKQLQYLLSALPMYRRVPCRSCLYLAENLYVRCAVNPKDVLTNRAAECRDYCPKGKKQLPEVSSLDSR